MPLAALNRYGEKLIAKGILPARGWSRLNVSHALVLSAGGALVGVQDLRETVKDMKGKEYLKAHTFNIPYRTKHTNGASPFFLVDNAKYLMGIGTDEAPEDLERLHKSSCDYHRDILENVSSKAASTVLNFFETFDPKNLSEYPFLTESVLEELTSTSNISFLLEETGTFAHDDDAIIAEWNRIFPEMMLEDIAGYGDCGITGATNVPIARIHPAVTGVPGAQTSGASLVSFGTLKELSAYSFYGKINGAIGPVSLEVAETYGKALKYLISNKSHNRKMGDTLLLFWAEDPAYDPSVDIFSTSTFGRINSPFDSAEDEALFNTINAIVSGKKEAADADEKIKDLLNVEFCIMGIRPHAARLAIIMFERNTLGNILGRVVQHYRDTEIISGLENEVTQYNCYEMIKAMRFSYKKQTDDTYKEMEVAFPVSMDEQLMESILTGKPYPESLLKLTLRRIFKDGNIHPARIAFIRGYLNRNAKNMNAKEVATVTLNTDSNYVPYLLGQLFWTYENLQYKAHQISDRSLNVTIKDKYFSSAATTPARVFGTLENLSIAHRKKLRGRGNKATAIHFEKRIGEIWEAFSDIELPARFTAEESAVFCKGYYDARKDTFARSKELREQHSKNANSEEEI